MAKADDEDTPPFNEFVALANKLLRRLLDEFHHADLAKRQTREAPTTSCVRRNLAYFDYRVEAPVPPRDIVCPQPIEAEPPLPTTPAPTVQKSTKNYEQDRMHAALKKRWPPDGLPPEEALEGHDTADPQRPACEGERRTPNSPLSPRYPHSCSPRSARLNPKKDTHAYACAFHTA